MRHDTVTNEKDQDVIHIDLDLEEFTAACESFPPPAAPAQPYDVGFFSPGAEKASRTCPPKPAMESLADARVGLGLFIDEAERALASTDLTVDQRVHVATILSYVEGLAKRLDVVRRPGFVQSSNGPQTKR